MIFLLATRPEPHVPKSKTAPRKKSKAKPVRKSEMTVRRSAPADMPPDEFRQLGHSLVDAIADFYAHLPTASTASPLLPDAMRAKFGRHALPEKGIAIGPGIQ